MRFTSLLQTMVWASFFSYSVWAAKLPYKANSKVTCSFAMVWAAEGVAEAQVGQQTVYLLDSEEGWNTRFNPSFFNLTTPFARFENVSLAEVAASRDVWVDRLELHSLFMMLVSNPDKALKKSILEELSEMAADPGFDALLSHERDRLYSSPILKKGGLVTLRKAAASLDDSGIPQAAAILREVLEDQAPIKQTFMAFMDLPEQYFDSPVQPDTSAAKALFSLLAEQERFSYKITQGEGVITGASLVAEMSPSSILPHAFPGLEGILDKWIEARKNLN